jgi:hypothetical protein
VNERRTAISPDDQIGALAEDVAAAPIAVEGIGDESKILEQLEIEVRAPAAARCLERLLTQRIVELKATPQRRQLDMQGAVANLGVECNFGD